MILRLILVGLVTSMGFELPSGGDVSSWVESSRAWAYSQATTGTASGLPVVATQVAADYHATDADGTFLAAQGDTLATFAAADEATVETPALVAEQAPDSAATVEVVEVVGARLSDGEEMAVTVLLADNAPDAEPTALVASRPEPAPAAIEAPASVIVVEVAAMVDEADPVDEVDAAPTRGERLARAVRLTREAAQAWAEVIDEPAAAEATDLDVIDAR